MNKKTIIYGYYRQACKALSRLSSWFELLGKYVRAPKERMHFVYLPVEKKVETPQQKFVPLDIVDAMIDRAKGTAVMNECLCRVGGRCEDYPHDLGCLVMGGVETLDPKIGRRITKQEAREHVRRGVELGLYPMISHYERDAMIASLDLDHIMLVCLCCPCHCVARNAGRQSVGLENSFNSNSERLPTVQIHYDASKCTLCQKCVKECIAGAISFENGGILFDDDKCKGCGHCTIVCDAFSVEYDIQNVDEMLDELDVTRFIV